VEDAIKKGVLTWEKFRVRVQTEDLARAKQKNPSGEPYAQAFRVAAIEVMVGSVLESFKAKYKKIMNGSYHSELLRSSDAAELRSICKGMLKDVVFPSELILRVEMRGKTVIRGLRDMFWNGAAVCDEKCNTGTEFDRKIYQLVSPN